MRNGKLRRRNETSRLLTNLKENLLTLLQLYRQRANVENAYDELKNQWGWGGFTTQDRLRCQVAARETGGRTGCRAGYRDRQARCLTLRAGADRSSISEFGFITGGIFSCAALFPTAFSGRKELCKSGCRVPRSSAPERRGDGAMRCPYLLRKSGFYHPKLCGRGGDESPTDHRPLHAASL